MSARHYLNAYNYGWAVGRLEASKSVPINGHINWCVILQLKKKVNEIGNAVQKHADAHGRNTTLQEDQ